MSDGGVLIHVGCVECIRGNICSALDAIGSLVEEWSFLNNIINVHNSLHVYTVDSR